MKSTKIIIILTAIIILNSCTSNKTLLTSTSATLLENDKVIENNTQNMEKNMQKRIYSDNAFIDLPREYLLDCEKKGTIETFNYLTRDNQTEGSKDFEKYALVYLPYGYNSDDLNTKYNVLYLMHGGTDSPEWFFGKNKESSLKNVIDNMINNGDMEKSIICAVSYYTEYSGDATKNCKDFYIELMTDVIPVFETKYHTYAESITKDDLVSSRMHRAFGGFSMGACATWATFEHCLDEIAYYLPISGDCWAFGMGKSFEAAQFLAKKATENGKSFYIYSGCGRNDIAEPNLTPLINEMKKYDNVFKYCDNFSEGNLYQCIYERGGHDINTVMRIIFNGLPKMYE